MKHLLTIGQTGLTLPSLTPRLYDGVGALQVDTADLTLVEVVGSPRDYVLSSDLGPPPSGGRWAVTLNWPQGFGTVVAWPEHVPPTKVVLPVRATGVAGAIAPIHFVNRVPSGDPLTVVEAMVSGGDYLISGWSRAPGSHTVAADFGGMRFQLPTWSDSGGPGTGRVIATVEYEAEVQYLVDRWKRSVLSARDEPIEVPDPGHGFDEISPIVSYPFDPEDPDLVDAPFSPNDLRDRHDGGAVVDGTGFLGIRVKARRPPRVRVPGLRPQIMQDTQLDVTIVTPNGRGPGLSMLYAGAIAALFRFAHFDVDEAGIDTIRNLEPPSERPVYEGTDGSWRYDRLSVPMVRFYQALAIQTA